ncbi:MAG: hypothetical protein IJC30_04590, partial [Alphaproteobacteria bacterium]|nr:hypothetical protein [Alphaproteobacteria bacterium]
CDATGVNCCENPCEANGKKWCCQAGMVCSEVEGECCTENGKTCCPSSQTIAKVAGVEETMYTCCDYYAKYVDDPDGEKAAEIAGISGGQIFCSGGDYMDCEEYDGEIECWPSCNGIGEGYDLIQGCCHTNNTDYCNGTCCKYKAASECGCWDGKSPACFSYEYTTASGEKATENVYCGEDYICCGENCCSKEVGCNESGDGCNW